VRFFVFTFNSDNAQSFRGGPSAHRPSVPRDEEMRQLDQVVAAVRSRLPDDFRTARVVYRAAGRHRETDLRIDPPAPPAGEATPEPTVIPLPDSVAADVLWRIRTSRAVPQYGAPFEVRVEILRPEDPASPIQTGYPVPNAPDLRGYITTGGYGAEPAWRKRPSRRQLRRDLREFPYRRSIRPFWLRSRLSLLG
jgi:hypothetical protein